MKRTVTILLLVVMLVSIWIQPVAAAGIEAKLETKTTTAKPGETIDFTVAIESETACQSFGLVLQYDKDVLEVEKGKCTLTETLASSFTKDRGFVAMFEKDTLISGEVGTMVLRVKDGAAAGETTVSFKTSAMNEAGERFPFDCNTVTIQIAGTGTQVEKPTQAPVEKPTDPSVQHKHTYSGKWSSDKDQHWKVCTTCGEKTDVQKHVAGPEPTEQEHQRCTVCQYVIKPALGHQHEYSVKWECDENSHWQVCDCGEKAEQAEHTWNDDGVCAVCLTEKLPDQTTPEETTQPATEETEASTAPTTPTEQPEQDVSGLTNGQWIIGGLILVAVIAAGAAVYFFLAKKRQQ